MQVKVAQPGQDCPWMPSGSRSRRAVKVFSYREKKEGAKLKSWQKEQKKYLS